MENPALAIKALAIPVGIYSALFLYKAWGDRQKLGKIPTVGPTGIFSSYLGAYRFIYHGRDMIQEGYDQYRGSAFKIAGISKWLVFVRSREMIEELRKAPEDQASFQEAAAEALQTMYTIGPEIHFNSYHIPVIRSTLTRNMIECFPELQDEISTAFGEHLPATEGWTEVTVLPTIMQIVCRTSNRVFVGLPLCRDLDYRSLNITFTIDVINSARAINLFPTVLQPLAGRIFSKGPAGFKRAMRHIEPMVLERLYQEEQFGKDWPGKPNDIITWLLDAGEGSQRTPRDVAVRLLHINFASIHTTSMSFTEALFNLAAYPSHVAELREEVESVIKEEGMTKTALQKMHKVDSFIKETLRLAAGGALIMQRVLMKDFTFSDGTFVPKGNMIAVPNYAIHHDEENYTNPNTFDGFRFSRMRENEEGGATKHQAATLGLDYIAFGNGRHACPGRFFAVNQLKALFAHVLLHYDVMLKEGCERPADKWFSHKSTPDPAGVVMFRKRRV
ncbi:hypothetical protein H0H81_009700 [Sphagnurus paluster]|uniref:Cytochrome P450 n=1 Tax=Sphagnurus paluster TaxID=117069 RepID=A0A9P7KKQ7_9AGAR|nr:hypothetical protein H0H81_009700 [Sphagnurus paluster]